MRITLSAAQKHTIEAVGIAIGTPIAIAIVQLDPAKIDNWKLWVAGVLLGALKAGLAVLLATPQQAEAVAVAVSPVAAAPAAETEAKAAAAPSDPNAAPPA